MNTLSTSETIREPIIRPPVPPRMAHKDRPIQPDLSFHDTDSANMIYSAYICVSNEEGWNVIANFNETSFMFSQDPVIKELMSKINENFEKIREFVYVNHLRISLTLMGMFVLASALSFLAGNFANAAFFLIAAMMFVF